MKGDIFMYTAENLKQDLLVNVNNNLDFESDVYNALLDCQFQFNDSGEFTRIRWNTFKRDLVIFCAGENRDILEKSKNKLFKLCDKIHGEKDEFLLMSLEIIAKSILSKTRLTDTTIQIKDDIIIDRTPENELGRGGFGKVYKYYDKNREEIYAYKIYEPSVFQESTPEIMKRRFIREGKKLLHYSHENVVKAYDFGFLGDESAYIKLEYIIGDKLIDYLNLNSLTKEMKEKLCMQYISAMSYVHSKSDMHRDISYSNVMVDKSENIKILDFGFARGNDDTTYDSIYKDISHKFAIPGETYSMLTEVYCIGAILFSIVTKSEFNRENLKSLDTCECDAKLIDIIRICLSTNPEERFKNAMEIENTINTRELSSLTINEIKSDFNLDSFRNLIVNGFTIYFSKGYLPNFDTIKEWVEKDLKDILESHMFLSRINLMTLLKRLPNFEDFILKHKSDYNFEKELFEDMYKFYNQSQEKIKSIFIKNILIILLEISYENEGFSLN